jgi:hypothetical protein
VRSRLGRSPLGHLGSLRLGLGLTHFNHFVFEGVATGANLKRRKWEGETRRDNVKACDARLRAMRVRGW